MTSTLSINTPSGINFETIISAASNLPAGTTVTLETKEELSKPRTAWNFFVSKKFHEVQENPDMAYRSVSKELGRLWRTKYFTAPIYNQLAKNEAERFKNGEKIYKVIKYDIPINTGAEETKEEKEDKVSYPYKLMKDVKDCKKPRSAYNFFCSWEQETLALQDGMGFKSLGKELARRWNSLSEEDKMPYQEMANKDIKDWFNYHMNKY